MSENKKQINKAKSKDLAALLEYNNAQKYIVLHLFKVLTIFCGHIKDQHEFLSRIKYVFGSINYPIPKVLGKHFNPTALIQHNLSLVSCYRKYNTSVMEKLSNGSFNASALGPYCSMLNIIEQHVIHTILGPQLKKHPRVVLHAINSDKPALTPSYNKNDAIISCHQMHPHYLVRIPTIKHKLVNFFIRYFDVKANNDNRFSHCRLSIVPDLSKLSFKEIKNILAGYVTTLQNEIKRLKISDKNHPYNILFYKLKTILKGIKNEAETQKENM